MMARRDNPIRFMGHLPMVGMLRRGIESVNGPSRESLIGYEDRAGTGTDLTTPQSVGTLKPRAAGDI
jgi:hypothetical protein